MFLVGILHRKISIIQNYLSGGLPNLHRSVEFGMPVDRLALTFDDVLLKPKYSDVLPRETDLTTQLTKQIRLNIPLVSAAMDTVTEFQLAIAIAQEGGLGIIHKNLSAEDQAAQVNRVKKFESGVITDPITVSPDKTIRDVLEITLSLIHI